MSIFNEFATPDGKLEPNVIAQVILALGQNPTVEDLNILKQCGIAYLVTVVRIILTTY